MANKTHYDPFSGEDDYPERSPCGALVTGHYNSSRKWDSVNCKRCLTQTSNLTAEWERQQGDLIHQLGN